MEPWFTNAGCCLPAWASLNLHMRAAVKLRRCCKGNWYSTTPPPPVLLVTVPLCPLYNPGNPRTTSSTARRQRCRSECGWHGAGTPRCRGEGHDGAEQPVPSLRCGGPNLPSQPPTTFPGPFLTASVILSHKLKAFLQYLLYLWQWPELRP